MKRLLKTFILLLLVLKSKFFRSGSFRIFRRRIRYNDSISFYGMYNELIRKDIYRFNSSTEKPVIIDCGANIGLSVLYFNQIEPNSTIHAFEPDPKIREFLHKNTQHLSDKVTIHPVAVWNENTELEFGMEGADMSSIYSKTNVIKVNAIKTSEFISQFDAIELLKIDIEGAELEVIRDCDSHLGKTKKVFIEYHSFPGKEQCLDEILAIMKRNGFRHQILPSRKEFTPFLDQKARTFDVLLNLFFTK